MLREPLNLGPAIARVTFGHDSVALCVSVEALGGRDVLA